MADDKKTTEKADKVVVKGSTIVDPQFIVHLSTNDGSPFDAYIRIDFVIRNVNDTRLRGYAHTDHLVTDSEIIIPVNFPDTKENWDRVCEMEGSLLGYGFTVTLRDEDGTEHYRWITGMLHPTNDPPITMPGVIMQYANDPQLADEVEAIEHRGFNSHDHELGAVAEVFADVFNRVLDDTFDPFG